MPKDNTFYFSHDYNARTDEKIKRLLVKHSMLGYGVYWAIVENLYNNTNVLQLDYDSISYELHTDIEVIKSVINDFGLFVIIENGFSSNSVQRRIDERNAKSIKAKESINKRWNNTNVLPPNNDSNTIKIKENKGKENKDVSGVPPQPPSEAFINFQKWIKDNASEVARMKKPFTEKQFIKISDEYPPKKIKLVLLDMHNWKPLNQKRVEAYLTFVKFAKNDNNQKPKEELLPNGLTQKENDKIFGT